MEDEQLEPTRASDEIAEIARALRQQTVECRDFLILEAAGSNNYFVQFPSPSEKRLPPGELPLELFSEAVSNEFLEPPNRLSVNQEGRLRTLGWSDPGPVRFSAGWTISPNWWRIFPLGSDDRFQEIAATVHATLVEVYGHRGGLSITLAD